MKDSSTLMSLAMLLVNLDEGDRDYLDYLVPFASSLIVKIQPQPIVADELCRLIRGEFGLDLPSASVEMLLKRLVKRNYLRRDLGKYYVVKMPPLDNIKGRRAGAN